MALYNETYGIHGMQQDPTPMIDSKEYSFENFNIRFSTEGHNSKIVIKREKGTTPITTMKLYKAILKGETILDYHTASISTISEFPFVILGACVIDKYIVIFGKDWATSKDYIARIEKVNNEYRVCYLFDGTFDLGFDFEHPIETHPVVDTSLQKKIYFCDGINYVRCVNVVNEQVINNLGLLELGKHLQLTEELTVTKLPNTFGSLPGGKLQIAFAYGTDLESLTSIIDLSALYDCVYKDAGIRPSAGDETGFADHTFQVTIQNVDRNFEWLYMYFILWTSLNEVPIIYQKNFHIETNSVSYIINLQDRDVFLCNQTIEDLRGYNAIIPLTIQPYEGRMFAGNIKIKNDTLPKFDDSDLKVKNFYYKTVGHEYLRNCTYNYNPSDNTFSGSSYDNRGFRKSNWYKFGFIGQYDNGEWTDVMSLQTAQCDLSSKSEVNANNTQVDLSNVKYAIRFSSSALSKLRALKALGIKKLKPVCVYPSVSERTVISQGIVNPTVYRGKNRTSIRNCSSFAQPSWFFRPKKLFTNYYTDDHYSYTLRNVNDLAYAGNYLEYKDSVQYPNYNLPTITDVYGQYHANNLKALWSSPSFDNFSSTHCHWNENFREFRHGMSLPTKDCINAECEFSEISGFDYAYSDDIEEAFSKIEDYCLKQENVYSNKKWGILLNTTYSPTNNNYYSASRYNYCLRDGLSYDLRVFRPYINSDGYKNMFFIDESICTFNSPEIDYYKYGLLGSANISVSSPNYKMELVGMSQINGSLSDIRIAPTHYVDPNEGSSDVVYYNQHETVQGTCITDTELINVPNLRRFLFGRPSMGNTSSPFCYTSGPFWFDKLLVIGFDGQKEGDIKSKPYADSKVYTAIPNKDISSLVLDSVFTTALQPFIIINATSLDMSMLFLLYRIAKNNQERRVKRSYYNGVNQLVQSFYGELNQRNDDKDTPKYEFCILGNKIVWGKPANLEEENWEKLNHLIYTEATDIKGNYNAFGEFSSSYTYNNFSIYDALKTRLAGFQNLGITFESNSYKHHFNLNYLDDLSSKWYNFMYYPYSCTGLLNQELNTNNRAEIEKIINNSESGGGSQCYFYGWWKRYSAANPSQLSGLNSAGSYDWYKHQGRFFEMTFPYALPSSTGLKPLDDSTRAITPSKYGAHLYGQYSTDFPNALFDPYYAHVVYPFMHNNDLIPFCGTSSAYLSKANSRPFYNFTSSVLYSNFTTYFNIPISLGDTKQKFVNDENEFITIPYLPNDAQTQLYGFNNSELITYSTVSLTAATKWYRGWMDVLSTKDSSEISYVCKGYKPSEFSDSIWSDLVFSGYLPQLFTKSGRIAVTDKTDRNFFNNNAETTTGMRSMMSGQSQSLQMDYISSPHIVFHSSTDKKIQLLLPNNTTIPTGSLVSFNYYYKDFITTGALQYSHAVSVCRYTDDAKDGNNTYMVSSYYQPQLAHTRQNVTNKWINYYTPGLAWACANYIYPHTGNWQPLTRLGNSNSVFRSAVIQDTPYWMRSNVDTLTTPTVNLPIRSNCITTANLNQMKNSYNLFLANYVNTQNSHTNPYSNNTEFYEWHICGESVQLDDIINDIVATVNQGGPGIPGLTNKVQKHLDFLEGDTYFTRYNCLKTVLANDPVASGIRNGISECASVLLESYINLDGRYNSTEVLRQDSTLSYIMNAQETEIDKINPVYSQSNNLFTFFEKNTNYQSRLDDHFPTLIQWTPIKQIGSEFDSWGTFPAINSFYVDGSYGDITKLITGPSNQVFSLQEHAVSILDINPQALLSTEQSTIEINTTSSAILQKAGYLDRVYGCQNKWSVSGVVNGVYFMDNAKKIIAKATSDGVLHMSATLGFESWAKENLNTNNDVWSAISYSNKVYNICNPLKLQTGFVSYFDPYYNDIYFINKDKCLSLNPAMGCFTSFYSYNNASHIVNLDDTSYIFYVNDRGAYSATKMHTMYTNNENRYLNWVRGYYIDYLCNPFSQYEKVFNFISYLNECYDPNGNFLMQNGFNKLTVFNYSQRGEMNLNTRNTRIKFRTWRTEIPRDLTHPMDRIRGNWCRVKLEFDDNNHANLIDYSTNLYSLSINYSITEQPIVASSTDKTN